MQLKEAYLRRVVAEVEDLAERVAILKARIAKQKVSVTFQHRWELEYVRNRIAEFKRRVEELEEAGEENLEDTRIASALAEKDLEYAVDAPFLRARVANRRMNEDAPAQAGRCRR